MPSLLPPSPRSVHDLARALLTLDGPTRKVAIPAFVRLLEAVEQPTQPRRTGASGLKPDSEDLASGSPSEN